MSRPGQTQPRTSLLQWLDDARAQRRFEERPWLVLGKGPTFALLTDEHRRAHWTFGLNHVVRQERLTIAHIIDIDVAEACADALRTNCEWLLMPRVPHVRSQPGDRLLEDWFASVPVLRELDERCRLVWYNCSTAKAHAGSPVIEVEFFSSEAAFGILGRLGARVVRSLGVDGGRSYSTSFADLAGTTRLQNGQPLFDRQFERIARLCARHRIEHTPLAAPLRVAIVGGADRALAGKVLEASLRKHAARPLHCTFVAERTSDTSTDALQLDAATVALGCVDGLRSEDAAASPLLLHCGMAQPWRQPHDASSERWLDAFAEAVNAGVVAPALVRTAVARGHADRALLRLPMPPLAAAANDCARLEHRARCLQRELANARLSTTFRLGSLLLRPVIALRNRRRAART